MLCIVLLCILVTSSYFLLLLGPYYFCPLLCPSLHEIPFSSMAQFCPSFCDPIDCSMTDSPVHQKFLELSKTHVHRVGDAIQSSHCLFSLSPPAFILSKHQDLFQWVSSSHQLDRVLRVSASASVLPMYFQDWFLLWWTYWTACSLRDSQESSPTPSILWHSAFFIVKLSHTWLLEKP